MRVRYEIGDEVTLRRARPDDDLKDWGLVAEEFDNLLRHQQTQTVFTVVSEVSDDYYDITNGTTSFPAISSWHFSPQFIGSVVSELDL